MNAAVSRLGIYKMIKKDYLIFIYILFSCLIANSQTIDSVFC